MAPLYTVPSLLILLGCAYLIGYGGVSGKGWVESVTVSGWFSLPGSILLGFTVVAALYGVLAERLERYAQGHPVRPLGLVVFALALLAAMYVATYDRFGLMDLYPFVGLLVISLLIFRVETRVVAAVLFGAIVFGFYLIGAMEIGERDGERIVQRNDHAVCIRAAQA